MREAIGLRGLGGENRTARLRIHGLGFTDSTEVLREDGQDAKTDYLPENLTERWIQRRDFTRRTAETPASGGCWSSCCRF